MKGKSESEVAQLCPTLQLGHDKPVAGGKSSDLEKPLKKAFSLSSARASALISGHHLLSTGCARPDF